MSQRKTETEKKRTGTNRKRGKDLEKIDLGEIPEPEAYLPKAAHDIYYRIMRHIQTTGQLDKIDSLYVTAVSHDYHIVAHYTKEMQKPRKGPIQEFKNGTSNVSTEYILVRHALERIKTHNLQLGLNVRARENLTTFRQRQEKKKSKSNLAKVLGKAK